MLMDNFLIKDVVMENTIYLNIDSLIDKSLINGNTICSNLELSSLLLVASKVVADPN